MDDKTMHICVACGDANGHIPCKACGFVEYTEPRNVFLQGESLPLLSEAVKRSRLSPEGVVERALKLWVELYDLDKTHTFTMCSRTEKVCQSINDWELISDDPNKVV